MSHPSHPHSHDHDSHDHHGHHHHAITSLRWPFFLGILINLLFVAIEFYYGKISESIALLADASHNLQDVFSLCVSALALYLSTRPHTKTLTYGYKKGTILSALLSSSLLVIASLLIIYESILRMQEPLTPTSSIMMKVAAAGVVVNLGTALLFFRSKDHELNSRAAYIHLMGDAFISFAVVISGFFIQKTGFALLDPLVSIAIALFIIYSSTKLLLESLEQSLDGVPARLNISEIQSKLLNINGVKNCHHIHVWGISTTEIAFTGHLILNQNLDPSHQRKEEKRILHEAQEILEHEFHIHHATIQIEWDEEHCLNDECLES